MRNAFSWVLAVSVLLITGCASWDLKDRCEKTNWFEYSQKVAFDGKYLEEDGFVKDCKGVDRTSAVQLDLGFKQGREKMCQYDEIFTRAKEGVPVFFKFCDGLEMNRMKSLYTQGLVAYCTPEKGYSFAKAGKIYQNLCSPAQEKSFLPGYYRGRREYLTTMIAQYGERLNEIRSIERSYAITEERINREYFSLPNAMECSSVQVYDEASKQNVARTVCREASYIASRRSSLWSDLNQIRGQLNSVRGDWREIEQKITQAKTDLLAVP